jgi:hypothetical protein
MAHHDVGQKMISEYLVPVLKSRYADKAFVFSNPPDPIATLVAPCNAIGRLEIEDDDHEITVYISEITHAHFGCYDESLTKAEKEKEISEDVIRFIDALFSDRVVLHKSLNGLIGGWKILTEDAIPESSTLLCDRYLWTRKL